MAFKAENKQPTYDHSVIIMGVFKQKIRAN